VARNYWPSIAWVEVAHEASIMAPGDMENRINYLRSKLAARGLPDKPFGAIFSTNDILITNAIVAQSLSFVNIETYMHDSGDVQTNRDNLNSYLSTAKSRVRNAGKWIFLTGQAFDRCPGPDCWTNMGRLEEVQRPVYLNAYNDNNVVAIQMFAFNRGGGTKAHRVLQPAHYEIAEAMGIARNPLKGNDRLLPGERLYPGQEATSSDGRFHFVYQGSDGNLVLYRWDWVPIWASNTQGTSVGYTKMGAYGNVIVLNAVEFPVWASGPDGLADAYLIVQNDGNVVIYGPGGSPIIWATDTCCY
jgi:hypothetical protein